MIFTQDYPQAIIFDLDGTLVDSVPDLCRALNEALSDLCLELNQTPLQVNHKQVRLWVGNGSHTLIERALLGLDVSLEYVDRVHGYFLTRYEACVCEESYLYPGVLALLTACQQKKLPMALVTNKPIAFVPALLNKLGISEFFEILLGGDSLSEKKPSALPLLHAAQHLSIEPGKCLMVGDSEADRASAKNAAVPCVLLEQGYNQGKDLSQLHPEWLLKDIKSLLVTLCPR